MTYPFIPARWYTAGGIVEARAVLWHMAEGYSTVEYLTHPSLNVSAHFVIERTGDIVQMVKLRDASHSAHIAIDPDDADADDCGGLYDPRIAKQVVGSAGWADINAYVIAVEVEGFRAAGPNDLQRNAIAELGTYLRAQLPTLRGNLGHRDVQDYKSCPGCLFPWDRIGGHGPYNGAAIEVDDMAVQLPARVRSDYRIDVPASTPWWSNSALTGSPSGKVGPATLDYFGATIGESSRAVRIGTAIPYADKTVRPTLVYIRDDAGKPYYVSPDTGGEAPSDPATDLGPGLYRVS